MQNANALTDAEAKPSLVPVWIVVVLALGAASYLLCTQPLQTNIGGDYDFKQRKLTGVGTINGLDLQKAVAPSQSGHTGEVLTTNGTSVRWAPLSLPVATTSILGGVKQGSNITITADGTISSAAATYSLPAATPTVLGGVKEGKGVEIAADGTITYTLPPATALIRGGVKEGKGVQIAADGTIHYTLPVATTSILGGVKAGSNINIMEDGTISSTSSTTGSYTLPKATNLILGGVKEGIGIDITADGTLNYALPPATTLILGGVKKGKGIEIAADGTISTINPPSPDIIIFRSLMDSTEITSTSANDVMSFEDFLWPSDGTTGSSSTIITNSQTKLHTHVTGKFTLPDTNNITCILHLGFAVEGPTTTTYTYSGTNAVNGNYDVTFSNTSGITKGQRFVLDVYQKFVPKTSSTTQGCHQGRAFLQVFDNDGTVKCTTLDCPLQTSEPFIVYGTSTVHSIFGFKFNVGQVRCMLWDAVTSVSEGTVTPSSRIPKIIYRSLLDSLEQKNETAADKMYLHQFIWPTAGTAGTLSTVIRNGQTQIHTRVTGILNVSTGTTVNCMLSLGFNIGGAPAGSDQFFLHGTDGDNGNYNISLFAGTSNRFILDTYQRFLPRVDYPANGCHQGSAFLQVFDSSGTIKCTTLYCPKQTVTPFITYNFSSVKPLFAFAMSRAVVGCIIYDVAVDITEYD